MSYTSTLWSLISRFSSGSTERMPICRTIDGVIAGASPPSLVSASGPMPHRQATGMPWMLPEGVTSLVLKSECASSHSTRSFLPTLRQCCATAVMEPMARQWSPPSMMGNRCWASSVAVASITARFHATTSSRCR
ncbi:hypothetical protein D9M69_662990 [compost metagenome]